MSSMSEKCPPKVSKALDHGTPTTFVQGPKLIQDTLSGASCCFSVGLRYCTVLTRRYNEWGANALTTPPGPDENVWRAG